jgi:hypothetical protein
VLATILFLGNLGSVTNRRPTIFGDSSLIFGEPATAHVVTWPRGNHCESVEATKNKRRGSVLSVGGVKEGGLVSSVDTVTPLATASSAL